MAISIHRPAVRPFALIACETLLIVSAIATSAYLRLGLDGWASFFFQNGGLGKALLITGICQLSLYYCDLYDLRTSGDRRDVFVRLLQALGATSIILALIYFWFPSLIIGRGVFLWACGMVIVPGRRVADGVRLAVEPRRAERAPADRRHQPGRGRRWRASCSSAGASWASRSSASSTPIRRWSARRCSTRA